MSHREFKDALYTQFAVIGHAVASPKRLELLDLLAQGEKTVEILARESSTAVKNTSAHLRVLRQAHLVETRRDHSYVYYRLASGNVLGFLRSLQALGRARLAEVERLTAQYLTARDTLSPVSFAELQRLVRRGEVTLIDVRPRAEYEAGHIPGALSVPIAELPGRIAELPKRKEIVAYCRGAYCLYSTEAVALLRSRGLRAKRAHEGLPDWQLAGFPVERGPAPARVVRRRTTSTRA